MLIACLGLASPAHASGTVGNTLGVVSVTVAALAAITVLAIGVAWRGRLWRFEREAPENADGTRDGLVLLLVGLGVWVVQGLGSVAAIPIFRHDPEGSGSGLAQMAVLLLGGSVGGLLALLIAVVVLPSVASAMGLRAQPWSGLALGAVLGALVTAPVLLVSTLAMRLRAWLSGEAEDPLAHKTLEALTEPTNPIWAIAVTVACVTLVIPLLEEVFYRGALQQSFARAMDGVLSPTRAVWSSIVITSVVFAFMHVGSADWHALPGLFVLSVALGIARERSGALWAPFAMHAVFNALNVTLAMTGT
ncbi:MAG: CPBP family intramembrane glutamic endopeptidase [Planctomycetota bacterium]